MFSEDGKAGKGWRQVKAEWRSLVVVAALFIENVVQGSLQLPLGLIIAQLELKYHTPMSTLSES